MYRKLIRKGEAVLKQNEDMGVEYLTFPLLETTGIVKHMFSTRLGGVSVGIWSSMNLSYTRGDDERAVTENYRRIAGVLEGRPDEIVCSDQTHTVRLRRVSAGDAGKGVTCPKDYQDIDGLITDVPGLILATFYADCVPLYFVDPRQRAIGLSHSGWRGTAGGIGPGTLAAMKDAFGTKPEDVFAAIGPSICRDCYEVGEDVAEEFIRLFPERRTGKFTRAPIVGPGKRTGKFQLDLWQANRVLLLEAGVRAEHLAVTDICTCCNPEYLFSHRASEGKRGNLGAFLKLL